jgi:hypothetical protein
MESTGLKMKISLNQKTPFYLLRPESTPASEVTGATNLMSAKGLENSYIKLTSKLFFLLLISPSV